MKSESVNVTGPGQDKNPKQRPSQLQARKATRPTAYKDKYKTITEPVSEDLTGVTLQSKGVNLPSLATAEKHDYPVKREKEETVPERATPQNDEEEEEDEFIRKLREELEMLKEIEEVVQNVLACIKLGLPIRITKVPKIDYKPGIKKLPMFHCERCKSQWEKYGNVSLQCANPDDIAVPISKEAAFFFEKIFEEKVQSEEKEEDEKLLGNMRMFVKLANVRKKKKQQKRRNQKDSRDKDVSRDKEHSADEDVSRDNEGFGNLGGHDVSSAKEASSESEIGDGTGIFWHKTDSGTNVYVVDDTEDTETTKGPQSAIHADREGQGKLRRIRLSEAIKQQDHLEKRSDQPLEASFAQPGADEMKLTGEVFAFSGDASKGKTAQERANEWFQNMKAKQKLRTAQVKRKRRKSVEGRVLHHSKGLDSPVLMENSHGRGKRSEVAPNSSSESYTSGSGSSIESWEEESYIEIMDEVTGELKRVEVRKKRGRRYKSRSGKRKKRHRKRRGDKEGSDRLGGSGKRRDKKKRKGKLGSTSSVESEYEYESSYWSDSTFDDEPSESSGDTRQKKKRGKKRRHRHDEDLDVNITLEDLLEDCAGDEELTEFLKDLIQSGENETVKLSEIETLLTDLEEVSESKSLMKLLEAPNMADLVASSKEPFKLKKFLQKIQAVTPREEKFQSLGVKDIENLLPDLLDPNKQKDFRYQKMLKSLVNKAKERIQDQIEAAKKGKRLNEEKYYERMGRGTSGFYDEDEWEEGEEEKERTGGRRMKKKKTRAGVKQDAFTTLVRSKGTGQGMHDNNYDKANEMSHDEQGCSHATNIRHLNIGADLAPDEDGKILAEAPPPNFPKGQIQEKKGFVTGYASYGYPDSGKDQVIDDEVGENRYLQRNVRKIKKNQPKSLEERKTIAHHSKTVGDGGLRRLSLSTKQKEEMETEDMINEDANLPKAIVIEKIEEVQRENIKPVDKPKPEARTFPTLPKIKRTSSKPVAEVKPTVKRRTRETSSSSSESELDETEARMIAYRSRRKSIFEIDVNEFAQRFSFGFSGLGTPVSTYQNRKDSLIKQADNLKNKKAVPKKKRNLDLPPAPPRSKGSSISKQSRKMMRDLVNPKPIANYVKKPVSKPKDEVSQAKKVTKEPNEKKQEKLDDSGDIVDGGDKLDRESKLSKSKENQKKESKDTLSDESSEELKRLKSKSYDDSEKQGLQSSTFVVEPQSEIAMDKSDLTKESEVVAVYDINAK